MRKQANPARGAGSAASASGILSPTVVGDGRTLAPVRLGAEALALLNLLRGVAVTILVDDAGEGFALAARLEQANLPVVRRSALPTKLVLHQLYENSEGDFVTETSRVALAPPSQFSPRA